MLVRRITLTLNNLTDEDKAAANFAAYEQLDIFADHDAVEKQKRAEDAALERERRIQHTVIGIKRKFGKNAIIKGLDLEEGATSIARNGQIGGHKA